MVQNANKVFNLTKKKTKCISQTMSKEQREPYEKRAKDAKIASKSNPKTHERFTSQGVAFSEIDRQKEEAVKKKDDMVRRIKKLIDDGFMENSKTRHAFIFRIAFLPFRSFLICFFVFLLFIYSYCGPDVLLHDGQLLLQDP